MTTEHSALPDNRVHDPRGRRAPSVHVQRARKLLVGGLMGGLLATVISLVGFGFGFGAVGVRSAAVAAVCVLFFYLVGQAVMVAFADAGARLLLAVAMASYTTRVALIGLALLVYQRHVEALPSLLPIAVFITTVAVVVGWLVVEVVVFSRLRIEAYDQGYDGPPTGPDADAAPRVGEP